MSQPPRDTDNDQAEKVRVGANEFLYQQLADALDLARRTLDALEGQRTEPHGAPRALRRGGE